MNEQASSAEIMVEWIALSLNAMNRAFVLVVAGLLPGCATILDGSTMKTTVETNPPGATCALDRMGERVASVAPTPGVMMYPKTKQDATLTCALPGFATVVTPMPSKFTAVTFANLAIGGAVGFLVDASTGANWTYPKHVIVDMPPGAPETVVPVQGRDPAGKPTS